MNPTSPNAYKTLARIVARTWIDPTFKSDFVANPRADVNASLGFDEGGPAPAAMLLKKHPDNHPAKVNINAAVNVNVAVNAVAVVNGATAADVAVAVAAAAVVVVIP